MENIEKIYEIMSEGWKEAAEELLRLNFLCQTSGESYGLTAALTQISENQKSSTEKNCKQRRMAEMAL